MTNKKKESERLEEEVKALKKALEEKNKIEKLKEQSKTLKKKLKKKGIFSRFYDVTVSKYHFK